MAALMTSKVVCRKPWGVRSATPCPIRLWNGLSTAYNNAGNGIDEGGKDWAAPDFKRT
jgi:hypothetical protein